MVFFGIMKSGIICMINHIIVFKKIKPITYRDIEKN